MKTINNETRGEERAYYGSNNACFDHILINGPEDGESAFKECENIKVYNSNFFLRYPFWHNTDLELQNCKFEQTCRAGFWYDKNVTLNLCFGNGVKAFRECENISINSSNFDSEEIFWRCSKIYIQNSGIKGVYAFFQCKDLELKQVNFAGKYSFQYVENLKIDSCSLNTKDAFWHAKNVVVSNSFVSGEYLGWYAENITFINCRITGTQPLCYAKNIKLINCTFEGCDLAFEYSEVNGNINGGMKSIKNPLKGKVEIDDIPELIQDDYDKSNGQFEIVKANSKHIKK